MRTKANFTILIVLLLTLGCKKYDNQTETSERLDAKGTWSLVSSTNSNGPVYSVNNSDYPCISNYKIILNEGGTGSYSYIGKDTCFITNSGTQPYIFGLPGVLISLNWNQADNKIIITFPNGGKKTWDLTISNSNPVIIWRDTINVLNALTTVSTYSR